MYTIRSARHSLCQEIVWVRKRLYSKADSPAIVAEDFLRGCSIAGPLVRKQILDSNQLQKLSLSLGRPMLYRGLSIKSDPPPDGTPLPPGYHLVYFTPQGDESELGVDGTDRTVNPPSPFTRRMWAGGSVRWVRENPLRIGDRVRETTEIVSATAKKTKAGEEMIVVAVKKEFNNEAGLALVDHRNWLFRREIETPQQPMEVPASIPLPQGAITRDYCQSPVSLFRFSALTFNGHKIHYSKEWCRSVEGHRDLVVHGPLNLINMLDLWRDSQKEGDTALPECIDYRATSPLYVGEMYRIVMEEAENGQYADHTIYAPSGQVAMRGKITAF